MKKAGASGCQYHVVGNEAGKSIHDVTALLAGGAVGGDTGDGSWAVGFRGICIDIGRARGASAGGEGCVNTAEYRCWLCLGGRAGGTTWGRFVGG